MHLVKQAVKAVLPEQYHFAVRSAGFRMLHAGNSRFCPCCRSRVRAFKEFGAGVPRPNAQCPVCAGLERDRLVARYFELNPHLLDEIGTVLHVAPERPIGHLLKSGDGVDYFSIDLKPGAAMDVMDLTRLDFADSVFDAIYCSNVLEHVERDEAAMSEIQRVLRPNGWAMILVPLYGEVTYEDFSITDPDERTRLYGQPDHVRAYGIDVAERLAAAGLDVWVEQPANDLGESEAVRVGVDTNEIIFFCRKRVAGGERSERPPARNFVPAFGRQPALRNRYTDSFQPNPHLDAAWRRNRTPADRRHALSRAGRSAGGHSAGMPQSPQ